MAFLHDRLERRLAEFVILLLNCRSLVVDRPEVLDQCRREELCRVKQLLLLRRLHLVRLLEVGQVCWIFVPRDVERSIQLLFVHLLMLFRFFSLARETLLLLVALQHFVKFLIGLAETVLLADGLDEVWEILEPAVFEEMRKN
jgi:hypothetical protein